MKKQSYEIYDFGLTDRPNFFLTKILQKYRLFKKWEENPHAYISKTDARIIFGWYNIDQKIDQLVSNAYIETMTIGTTRFGKSIVSYIPLVHEYSRTKRYAYFMAKYYEAINGRLSRYAQEIVRTLKNTKIIITDWNAVFNKCYNAYCAKGGDKSFDEYVSDLSWWIEGMESFNSADTYVDYVTEDLFGQRIHSIISQLPGPMRRHVYIQGQPTVEVDLSQSQPMILAKYLKQEIGDNSFSRTVHQTDIYFYIQDILGLANRELAKTALFRMIYGHPHSLMAEKFYSSFPDTRAFITNLKSERDSVNPSSKIYSNLAFKMQRTETAIFKVVWDKLKSNRKPYISIHDGILVKEEDSLKVKEIMMDVLIKHLGNTVKVNIKQDV